MLVSGDGDFSYAVKAVKDMGKHVEVAAFPSNLSWDLAQAADDREFFTPEYFADVWSKRRPAARAPAKSGGNQRRGWRLGRSRSKDSE